MSQENPLHKRNIAVLDAILAGKRAGCSQEEIVQKVKEATAKIDADTPVRTIPQKMEIGELVEGEGIYLGVYKPVDRDGMSLSKIFNVFAAPEDLPGTRTYVDAVKYLSELKGWHGYDGMNYSTDKELYKAIEAGHYTGGWIVPPGDILHGRDVDGKETTPDNILVHKDRGALKDTFHKVQFGGHMSPGQYWSSTSENAPFETLMQYVSLSNGHVGWQYDDKKDMSCRPVRLVEVKRTQVRPPSP